jgi:hypothetical protein
MPVQNQVLLLDFLAPVDDQLHNIVKMCLANRNIVGVDVFLLEGGEEELSCSNIIRVWSVHHNGYLQPLQQLPGAKSLVVWSS